MKIERRDGSQQRRILTGLIVDDAFVARISSKWTKEGLFDNRWCNIVASWCFAYYENYGGAPKNSILGLFENWAEGNANDKETVEIIERFLEGLSDDYEHHAAESNTEFLVDLAGTYFNKIRLAKLAETIEADLANGDIIKAQNRVDKFSYVDVGTSAGIDVLHNLDAIKQAFKRKSDPLITYPGALGNFFRDALERDALIAFQGPEKRGKTWWLLDIAWRAMQQGRKVAFFEVGDMSEGQIMLRFMVRASRRPLKATREGEPIKYPIDIAHIPDSHFATAEYEEHEFPNNLRWREAKAACERILKKQKSKESFLKLSAHANGTIGVNGLNSLLESWDRQGWGTPDVIVVDYADLLSPPPGIPESREQINATWKGLRRLSQEYHALVVTATQADADSYTAETQTMANFSEDKRKNAHVTGIVGINQTPGEKAQGLQRLNWLVLRESDFSPDMTCHVAGCLGIANPAILSIF